ncbi:MAG: histidine phosphatase family protein [Acidimicrobiia bacterium]
MRLYLIRHSLTPDTGKRLSSTDQSISLSPEGLALATRLGEHLRDVPLNAIYSSPHRRCRETAAAVARGRKLRPRVADAFVEADYGKWRGRPLKSLYRLKAWQELMLSASRFRFPGGEMLSEVQARAVAGIEQLVARHPDEQVAVASHGDVIKVIVAYYLGLPLDLSHRIEPMAASVSIVDIPKQGAPRVPVLNYTVDTGRWR